MGLVVLFLNKRRTSEEKEVRNHCSVAWMDRQKSVL